MIRGNYSPCLLILLFVATVPIASAQQAVSEKNTVATTARQSLQTWLAKIPEGREKDYGFSTREEFARATIGVPLRMATITPQAVLESGPAERGKVQIYDAWRAPVLVDGEYRLLLTVARIGPSLKVVEMGAANLAAELGHFRGEGIGSKAGTSTLLLRLFQLKCDFLLVAGEDGRPESGWFYPLQSARLFLGLGTRVKLDHAQLVEILALHFARLPDEQR
jgi:hypothetical protein